MPDTDVAGEELRSTREFCVLLSEEFFFACWYWYPEMSPEETAAWWRSVEVLDTE